MYNCQRFCFFVVVPSYDLSHHVFITECASLEALCVCVCVCAQMCLENKIVVTTLFSILHLRSNLLIPAFWKQKCYFYEHFIVF